MTAADRAYHCAEGEFSAISPYGDAEIAAAMQRIADDPLFPAVARYVYPDETVEAVRRRICAYDNVYAFQHEVMYAVNRRIIASSISRLTFSGYEPLSPTESYLFVSNHRDIMLDACLLQYLLVEEGFSTTAITFGSNLMSLPIVVDIGKSNKMFRIERPSLPLRAFYEGLALTSRYIRHSITNRGESVWIAQRNGRTKDGQDSTDPGVIKMLSMSGGSNRRQALEALHIVPMCVSYEWEPCDVQKAREVLLRQTKGEYVKSKGEDIASVISGIRQWKGRVHIALGTPLTYEVLSSLAKGDFFAAVAQHIDRQIYAMYRLCPSNYCAWDLLHGTERYSAHYSAEVKAQLLARLTAGCHPSSAEYEGYKEIFMRIYSTCVDNNIEEHV